MKLISFDETNDNNNRTINNAMTKKQKHTELCILFFSDRDEGDSKITIDTGSNHITSHSFGKNKDLGWVLSCHEK
jgi:hypothetical protein